MGSYNLQYLAIRRYEGLKEGLTHDEIIWRLAFGDAIQDLDCLYPHVHEKYTKERCNSTEMNSKKLAMSQLLILEVYGNILLKMKVIKILSVQLLKNIEKIKIKLNW